MSVALRDRLARARPSTRTAAYWAMVLNAEFLLVAGYYLLATDVTLRDPLLVAVPFVWINAAGWAVLRTDLPAAPARRRLVAAGVAVAYFLLLAAVGGIVNGPSAASATVLSLLQLPPGWNPALFYNGPLVSLVVLPYKLVGFAVLAYLVYARVLAASGAALGGAVGLFSCVSCAVPLVAGAAGALGGGAAAAAALENAYLLSTAVFLLTVGLLVRGPGAWN